MSDLLRIYAPEECGDDGYPFAWHRESAVTSEGYRVAVNVLAVEAHRLPEVKAAIKDVIRGQADHRCIRCGHQYPPMIAMTCPRGEWTPCDDRCAHGGPWRTVAPDGIPSMTVPTSAEEAGYLVEKRWHVQAQWRILTVHHLNGVKYDCRWWNLTSLCQRCHLYIQGKVVLDREFVRAHSDWFKPYAAAWYAVKYLDEELTREETMARLDELLALEQTHYPIPGL